MPIFFQVILLGLISCLFFTISFISLGYPLQWSIFLGVLGGWASGFIVKAWNTTDNPKSSANAMGENQKNATNPSNNVQSNREKNQNSISIFEWLFNRKQEPQSFNSEKNKKS